MSKMTDIFDQNDRYLKNPPKLLLFIKFKEMTVILVLNDQNDRYSKSGTIGHFGLK